MPAKPKIDERKAAEADRMISAAQALERGARALKDRALSLRQGRTCESADLECVRDLQWAAYDARKAYEAADLALDDTPGGPR